MTDTKPTDILDDDEWGRVLNVALMSDADAYGGGQADERDVAYRLLLADRKALVQQLARAQAERDGAVRLVHMLQAVVDKGCTP